MTGTYAGQFVMQGFLDLKMVAWKRVLLTRSLALVPALCVAFLEAPETVDNWLNILQSIQLPFALIPLLKFTSCENIMGEFVNQRWLIWLTGVISVVLIIMNFYLLVPAAAPWWAYFLIAIIGVVYLGFIAYVLFTRIDHVVEPIAKKKASEYDLECTDRNRVNYSAVTPPASFIDEDLTKEPFISPK